MADEEDDIEFGEVLTLGILGVAGIGILLFIAILAPSFNNNPFDDWGFREWGSIVIVFILIAAIILGVLLGSDDEGDAGGVFTGWGFALTVGALIFGLIALQTNYFGIGSNEPTAIDIDGDGDADVLSDQIPSGYVDYGEPQPYGWGNWGPPDEGLLTGGQGGAVGCVGGAIGLASLTWWVDGPLPFGEIVGGAIGCAAGAVLGYTASEVDLDGDPTTGL